MTKHRAPRSPRRATLAFVLAIGVALGFGGHHALRAMELAEAAATPPAPPTPVTAPAAVPPPTTAPPATPPPTTEPAPPVPTPTTTTVPGPPTYRTGDRGPEVARLQERLLELHLWVPAADGHFGSLTEQAVMAFQKHAGLARDGVAGPATLAALESATPVVTREGGDHVEIDLERQLLIVVRGDRTLAFNTSTGASGTRTPAGRFRVEREIDGVRSAPLGDLYRPKYFNAGIAVHGSPSIPGTPASHGCARLHDDAVDLLWDEDLVPVGTPVWVR